MAYKYAMNNLATQKMNSFDDFGGGSGTRPFLQKQTISDQSKSATYIPLIIVAQGRGWMVQICVPAWKNASSRTERTQHDPACIRVGVDGG